MKTPELKTVYKCIYCEKKFTRKVWYDKHTCKKQEIFAKVNNLDEAKALNLFNFWRKRNGFSKRNNDASLETFRKSPYARPFINLVEYTNSVYTINPYKYINWLIDYQLPEREWCLDKTIVKYREWNMVNDDYKKQMVNTYNFIRSYCNQKNIPINTFFKNVGIGDAFEMITSYKISPWVLFGFDGAVNDLIVRMEDRLMELDEHIDFTYWIPVIDKNDDIRNQINTYCHDVFRY